VEKYGRHRQATYDDIIRCMRFVSYITKATDTHSAHVIIFALPLQQWLQERAKILRYMYNVWLVAYCLHKFLHVVII